MPGSQELDPPPPLKKGNSAACYYLMLNATSQTYIEIIREHISWIFNTAKYSNLLPGKSAVIPRFVALNVKNRLSKKWTTPWH